MEASEGAPEAAGRARAATLALAVGLLVLSAAASGRAQQPEPTPPADRLFLIDSGLNVDDPSGSSGRYEGSFYWGIREANDAVAGSGVDSAALTLSNSLLNLSVFLQDELPAIDPSTATSDDPRIDIDGTDASGFLLRTADDVPDDFVLLHVMSGRADLVNLDIASGLVDDQGDPVALTVLVDRDAILGFRYDDDFGFDENITGEGAVRIESDGVITFSGTNDYTGGTHVVKGRLVGNDASLQGDFTLEEATRLEFRIDDTTQTRFFGGSVDGAGRLVKSGAGTLFVTGGTAAQTGGTEVAGGTLWVTPNSLIGDVEIARGAWLQIEQNGPTRFDGAISGNGSVRKTGSTQLVLGGANTFRGGLFVREGDVRGTTGTIPGNVTLEDAAAGPVSRLIFDQDVDGTHTGTINGTGQLLKEGTGRVLRDGVTNVDLTQIASGRLAGGAFALGNEIEVAAGGAIAEFTMADRQVFAGTVFGPGDVWKTGIGTLVLAGDARHTGETVVAEGTLELAADLPSSAVVRVDPGARLAGAGGRIGGDLDNRGHVALGGPGATLPVGGNATLAAGSVLEVSLDDAGNASRLAVAALATLADPRYSLDLSPGDYSTARTYTVLTAGGIVPGSVPGRAIDDLAFIDVVGPPAFVGSTVTLTVQEDFTNLAGLGITPNQVSTAIALEQVTTSGTADARAIRDGLVPLRTAQVPPVLDTMAGETLAAFGQSRIAAAQYFGEAISRRLRARNWELSRPPVGAGANVRPASVGAPRARGGPGAWIEPFGVFGDLDGRGNASDLTARAYGVSGGIDYRLPERLPFRGSEHWRVGLGVGYARHDLRNATGFMNGDGNGVQTAVYGGYRGTWLHAGAAVRFAWTSMQTDRRILFTSVDRHARASFEGREWGTLLEVGGHFGDRRRALLHPFVRFQYADTAQDAFAETGAGDLSLAVPDLAWESLLLTTGARVSRVFTLEGEFGLEPELRAAWTIDYGDRGRHVPATFWAVPGAVPFVTAGTELDRNSVSVGVGYVMMVGDVPLLSTHYDFQFGDHHTRHVISAALLLRW